MNEWALIAGLILLVVGFGVLMLAPNDMKHYGIMLWVFSVMLIHASGYANGGETGN